MSKSILGSFLNTDMKKLAFNNRIENIHYKKIRQSAKNRGLRRIEELAADIAEDGLEDNLVVRKIEDEEFEYELIAGHRRYSAILLNISRGDMSYEYIPCKVAAVGDLDARKRLILNNYQNDPLTPAEKLEAVAELKEIYKLKKEAGEEVSGRIQDIIASEMGLGKSQVANYSKILNNAIPEVIEKIKEDEMTIETALNVADLAEDQQKEFLEDNDSYTKQDIKDYQQQLHEEQLCFDEQDEIVDESEVLSQACKQNEDIVIDADEEDEAEFDHHRTIEESLTLIMDEVMYLKQVKMDEPEFIYEYDQLCKAEGDIKKLLEMLDMEYE